MPDKNDDSNAAPNGTKPITVAIGASAGGVQALQTLFADLPEDTGAAFVVVVHLSPGAHSELAEILGSKTRMPVVQVETTEPLRADHVYVIPPGRRLHLTDHEISSSPFEEPRGQRAPIDLFFRSLAEQHREGIVIILTGGGTDGTVGVRAMKEAGGIVIVQDPEEAEYESMPRSAVGTGIADFILPLGDIAGRVVDLLRNKSAAALPDSRKIDDDLLRRILAHLRVRTGHDFSKYKRSTVLRRIARRMQVALAQDLQEYYDYLRESQDEAQALLNDLLISVTTFFRDPDAFESLRTKVLPPFFAAKDRNEPLRVWVPGCATGEEAYSVAIVLTEAAARRDLRPLIQIFASDLDARALAVAREGRYPAAIEADVHEDRLRRFFTAESNGYRVRQELRDLILFASQNLLKDPPFSRVDLISCRNLLIYLDRDLQEQACSTFHYALNPGGFLLLGSAEGIDGADGRFRPIDRANRIYQSTAQRGEKHRNLPPLLGNFAPRKAVPRSGRAPVPGDVLAEAALHRAMLEKLAPPSALVDEGHHIVHLSEKAGRFIQPSGGLLNSDIVEMVRSELRFELRSALYRAFEQSLSTISLPIPVQFNGAPHRVHLLVRPNPDDTGERRTAVVMFIESDTADAAVVPSGDLREADETVRRLTQELELSQSRLAAVREESESANEELRAANEELQSINEEYRSTAEELETSKEELQSINEELQTVNSELKLKVETISRAHSDLQNLIRVTDFGTLFLDTQLHIKLFTERATELFGLKPGDEGRPITDFAHQLEYDSLIPDARSVLSDLTPIQREVRSRDGRWFEIRLRPYRTVENKMDGLVITFLDVTERRHREQDLRESERRLRQNMQLIELSSDPIFVWDFDGGVLEWNRGSEQLYGFTREEALGKAKEKLLGTEVPGSSFQALKEALVRHGHWSGELRHHAKDGRALMVESRMQLGSLKGTRLVLESTRDITQRKTWEYRQQLLLRELTHRVKNTLAIVQSIANQTMRNTRSREDFVERFSARLAALSEAHGLLVQSDWEGADIEAMARAQLQPYLSDNINRVHIDGEPTSLPAQLATPFGLVLHELASNAAKYGALSNETGQVALHWSVEKRNNDCLLTVIWKEKNGPPPKRGVKTGFGSILIDQSIPNAKVNRDFSAEGFTCTIALPLTEPTDHGASQQS